MLVLTSVSLRGQVMTTMGTDFWLTFLNNANSMDLVAYISGPRSCSVTLSTPCDTFSMTTTVTPGVVTSVALPQDVALNVQTNQLECKGVHVTATDTVSVYIAAQGAFSYDESIVLPTEVLRDRYIVQSYSADQGGSEFVLLAVEDSTWVDIYLTDNSSDGHLAGDTVRVLLPEAGNTFTLTTTQMGDTSHQVGDFSGTRIAARDCKRLAVFNGNYCVYIPDESTGLSCDHVMEQAIPTDCWGSNFLVVGSGNDYYYDRVRITALEDGCEVRKNGTYMTTLSEGDYYEYRIIVNLYSQGVDYITTTKPACVNLYFASSRNSFGDPSMVTISPLDQAVKNITFNSSSTPATNTHYVNVVVRAADLPYIRLDGNTLTQYFAPVAANRDYLYATIEVSDGSHTLRMVGGAGFVAYAFGLGSHESYAYSIGSRMEDVTRRIVVNNITVNDMSNLVFCVGEQLTMSVQGLDEDSECSWNFGDENVATGTEVTHTFDHVGTFHVGVDISDSDTFCFPRTNSLQTTVRIVGPDSTWLGEVVCDPFYVWRGDTCWGTGVYTFDTTNRWGCDSVLLLSLQVRSDTQYVTLIEGCDSVVLNGTVYYANQLVQTGEYLDQWGCDSVSLAQLRVNKSSHSVYEVNIMEGDTIVWIDGAYYYEETDSPTMVYQGSNGCDSVVHLQLHLIAAPVMPPIDSSTLWVPNAFTPEESTNNSFGIFCNDVTEAHVWIFNRQGSYITDFDGLSQTWDGRRNGIMCKADAYVYLIEYVVKSNPQYHQRKVGTVTLLR